MTDPEMTDPEIEMVADLFDQVDAIFTARGLTLDEKDLVVQAVSALNMCQLALGGGRFFQIACGRLAEIVPHLLKHQVRVARHARLATAQRVRREARERQRHTRSRR